MQDKVILITGSTSGIGLGIAKKFASGGARVVVNAFGKGLSENNLKDFKNF